MKRSTWSYYPCLVLMASVLLALGGCGGSSSGTPNIVPLSITASTTSVLLGKTVQFTANQAVSSWMVNGILGGNSTDGTITPSGLFTAPAVLPASTTVTISASGSASSTTSSLTINSDLVVSLTPNTMGNPILTSSTLSVTATISSAGAPSPVVVWTVNGVVNGNPQIGTIVPGTNGAAVYTAPAVPPSTSIQIVATSAADPSKAASLNLSVQAAQALTVTIVGLSGASANVTVAGPNGYSAQVASTQQLQVGPGAYTITSNPVVTAISRFYPSVASQSVTVSSAPTSVTVNYAIIIPSTTRVLDAAGMSSLTVSPNGTVITLSATGAVASSLVVGNVLVSAPTTAAPNGLLVKLLTITTAGQTVTATVQRAALTDAIQQGTIQFSQLLGPTNTTPQLQVPPTRAAARPIAKPQSTSGACSGPNTIVMPFNVPLTPEISVSGEDDVCPTFNMNLQINSFSVVSMDTEVTLGLHTSLGLAATLQGSFNYPYSFKTLVAGPYVVLVGDVPVVLQPSLTPYVGLSGNASASTYTGLTTDSTLTIGASYANGAWGPVDTAASPSVVGTATSVDGQLSVKAEAGLQAGIAFYGTVAGTLSGDAYLQFNSSLTANPCWVLTGGLEGTAGVSVSVLGKSIYGYTSPALNIYSAPGLQATSTCFAPTLTSVTPNSALQMGPPTTIALVGTNFVPDSVVKFNGLALATTFIDPSDLTAVIPASDLTVDGSFPITVNNPDTPGGMSTVLPFVVNGVVVKVSPTTASVPINKTQQFIATVSGTSNTAVLWSVNGVLGGNGTIGTIDTNGLYTAPAAIPVPASVLVAAISQAQPTATAVADVTVTTGSYSFIFFSYPGAAITSPAAINDNGDIVGQYAPTGNNDWQGFLYSKGTFSTILGPGCSFCSPPYTSSPTNPTGITNSGEILAGYLINGGTFTTLPNTKTVIQPQALGINNNGQVVGIYSTNNGLGTTITHGFLYSAGTYTILDYPGATAYTEPWALNDNGDVVGTYGNSSTDQHGFLYSNGVFTTLDILTTATSGINLDGVNLSGQIVGISQGTWVYQNGTTTQITPPSCNATATGINNKGQIVGFCYKGSSFTGFLATPQ